MPIVESQWLSQHLISLDLASPIMHIRTTSYFIIKWAQLTRFKNSNNDDINNLKKKYTYKIKTSWFANTLASLAKECE